MKDRIRESKDCGLSNLPFRSFQQNKVWLWLVQLAQDLIAWTKQLCLVDGARAWELKRLRYRLLHQSGRIARHARRTILRLAQGWAWAQAARRRVRAPTSATTSRLTDAPPRHPPKDDPRTPSASAYPQQRQPARKRHRQTTARARTHHSGLPPPLSTLPHTPPEPHRNLITPLLQADQSHALLHDRGWISNLPADTPREYMATLARLRWKIELDYRQLKGELGLDHYEGRSYLGWHHHTALVSAAHGFLTLERQHPNRPRPA